MHVVIAMRDDFAAECNTHQALQPVFHELTVLNPPTGGNLRRALVQPATKCGYRFEDDQLVEEILAEVEGERGALPLLAFAAARLWEKRDRENGLLPRQAYHDIGGVAGALARHAEGTIDGIGHEHLPIVRELFRNLVTAEGTRAVCRSDELLSVFDESQREDAEHVLHQLIDARLLTSYEIQQTDRHAEPANDEDGASDPADTRSGTDSAPTAHRIEIVHESLLRTWPRLVRWQTQDEEGALLRDQLKQAAHLWEERGRSPDVLWSGSALREYELWRERYAGKLTVVEESFADAMLERDRRRRRRRGAGGRGPGPHPLCGHGLLEPCRAHRCRRKGLGRG